MANMAKNLSQQYIWLAETILSAERITFKEIADKWRTSVANHEGSRLSKRTFHNWKVKAEEALDLIIDCEKCAPYRYYIGNVDELKSGFKSWLMSSMSTLGLLMDNVKLRDRILLEPVPTAEDKLPVVLRSMQEGKCLEVDYHGLWSDNDSHLTLEPYCVKLFRQRWYLLARSVSAEHGDLRVFSLEGISNAVISESKFAMPDDFSASDYFSEFFGIIADRNVELELVKIKADEVQARYIRAVPLHHSQSETPLADCGSVFSYYLRPHYDFVQQILSLAGRVEVLCPESLRQTIAQHLKTALDIYAQP